ncbi:uncharacterized protein LOC136067783 [Quercus suber]|uniref:uncharacterized protein LOC136067783 n=1 Tax=Quercus suber TaxID=58331 RepID=UPI0032DF8D36
MSVDRLHAGVSSQGSKSYKLDDQLVLGLSDADKVGTVQPHDNALVVTLRIGGYDVKRVMVDQGSAAEITYPDLYKGLNLKLSDLTPYSSSLISFEGRVVTPKGQIRLPVQIGSEVVEVDFIVVDVFSPYTAIVAKPWLHALGAVSSTLHQKIKYLSEGQKKEGLVQLLKENLDVFAWNAYEAPGVDPEFICHHLKVNPMITPKKQPPRRPSKEHAEAVREEVAKLKQAGAIKKVFYPEWLANTVVVKKESGKWRIPLALEDQEKTAFVAPTGNYHYKVMPFGLKNAGSTYQRMMTRMFEPQLGRNIEVYIDDMVVKSKVVAEHVKDLESTFEVLRKYKLRLNAAKCSFGVGSSKFLGYMVTHRGIEVNPDQIKAINELQALRNPKEVQKLTGMTAALNRFISRSADRCRPFFSLINKWKGFEWTEECAVTF